MKGHSTVFYHLLAFFTLPFLCAGEGRPKESGEYLLKKTLLKNYNTEVRPVLDDNLNVTVQVELAIKQIVDVNEKEESMTLSVYLRQRWHDPYLSWNRSEYNVSSITLAPSSIWVPDITLYNNVERENIAGNVDQLTTRVIVYHNGDIKWLGPAILASKCPMNVKLFPFDTQKCKLVLGSWAFHGLKLDVHASATDVDLASYEENSEWNLEKAVHKRNVIVYGCCVEPYPDVTVTVTLKRRPLFFILNLIIPIILMGVLTLLSFYLPAHSGERLSFAVTLLLAMTVFMLLVAEMIPAASDTFPLLGIYFITVMIEIVLMILTLCFTMKLHLKVPGANDEKLPKWLHNYVYNRLAFLFKVRTGKSVCDIFSMQNDEKKGGEIHPNVEEKYTLHNGGINSPAPNGVNNSSFREGKEKDDANGTGNILKQTTRTPTRKQSRHRGSEADIKSIMEKNIEVMTDKLKLEQKERNLKYQYEICAKTIDRFAFCFYILFFVIITLAYILSIP